MTLSIIWLLNYIVTMFCIDAVNLFSLHFLVKFAMACSVLI